MRQQAFHVTILSAFLCAAPLGAAFAQATIKAGDVKRASAGTTVQVPIRLVLPTGTSCATLQFNLTVEPAPGAPALSTSVKFASAVGPPSLSLSNGPATALVGWLSNFAPLLTGNVQLGTLSVPLPAAAKAGTTYTVTVLKPSGTTNGAANLELVGAKGTITLAAGKKRSK
jgi:hypothetical protein